uniref:NADH-ubiquinone oxidoreductase chain 2 n=1 Tax=Hydatina physis TaxID=259632 RepID=E6Y179_9GAST|nr:NADH dehydrogenase subunit 2 [Hydatina physis]
MAIGNILFLFLLVVGTIVSVSAPNWILCWAGMEISFLGLIPLLFVGSGYMSLNKEAGMKYFCIQAMGSALLLFGGLLLYQELLVSWGVWVVTLGLLLKLGIFPGHFWVPSVASGVSWSALFVLLTWQKIPPLALMLNFINIHNHMTGIFLILGSMSAGVGALIGINSTQTRVMLAASSVSHAGWMCIGAVFGGMWLYFLTYCFSLLFVLHFLYMRSDMLSAISIISLSGLPPFVMFLGKWTLIVTSVMSSINPIILSVAIISTLFSLFFYLKFAYSFMLTYMMSSEEVRSGTVNFWLLPWVVLNFSGVIYIVM